MLRIRTAIAPAALVASTLTLAVLLPGTALAQCAVADRCLEGTCNALQSQVHPTCDQPRSCTNINSNNTTELTRRLLINQQCLAARTDVAQCFSNPDPGHQEAIDSVQRAIVTCRVKLGL